MEVLSQSQIDDLLNSLTSGVTDIEAVQEDVTGKKIREYDFRSPKRFSRDQIKIIRSVYENYARLLSTYLTSLLRLYVNVECVHIEEQRYSEFSNALPDSVMTGIGELRFTGNTGENNSVIMDISRPVTFAIIERLLGGNGNGLEVRRDFTEIEMALMENVFKTVFPQMSDSWFNYYEVEVIYRKIETNSRLMQAISADDTVVILVLDTTVKDVKGNINICIPAVCLEDILKKIDSQYARNLKRINSAGDKERREQVMEQLEESSLELRCVVGQTEVTLADIFYLSVGDVIQLDKPVNSLVDLNVGDNCWFRGKVGTQRNKKAVQVKEVL